MDWGKTQCDGHIGDEGSANAWQNIANVGDEASAQGFRIILQVCHSGKPHKHDMISVGQLLYMGKDLYSNYWEFTPEKCTEVCVSKWKC